MAKIEVNKSVFDITKDSDKLTINCTHQDYDIIQLPNGNYSMVVDDKSYNIEVLNKDNGSGNLSIRINGRTINSQLENKLATLLKSMGMESGKKKLKDMKAPMPGLVLNVLVKDGDEVQEGQELLVLEAMKMENVIKSPQNGTIETISIQNQDKVEKNQVLLSFV